MSSIGPQEQTDITCPSCGARFVTALRDGCDGLEINYCVQCGLTLGEPMEPWPVRPWEEKP